jgi:photosystem II stability/assembly factor-like uncharacterized protein
MIERDTCSRHYTVSLILLSLIFQITSPTHARADFSSFSTVFTAGSYLNSLAMSADGQYQVIASQGEGVYTSDNYGVGWSNNLNSSVNSFYAATVAISADGSKIYAGTRGVYGPQGTTINAGALFRSEDYGITWSEVITAGSKLWQKIAVSDDGTKLVGITSARTGISGGSVVVTQDPELFISTDSGQSWSSKGSSSWWNSIAISSDGTRMWAASSSSGAWLSINSGATWTQKKTGAFYSLSASADARSAIVIEGGTLKMTTDTGTVWSTVVDPGAQYLSPTGIAISGNGKNLVLAVNTGFLWLSNNAGSTWIQSDYNSQNSGSYLSYEAELSVFITRDGLRLASVLSGSRDVEQNLISSPGLVTSLSGSVSGTTALLSWTSPSSAGDASISDYSIQYSTNGCVWKDFLHTATTSTSTTISGLTNSTPYQFRIAGVNAWGIGNYEIYLPPLAPAPGAPTGLTGIHGDESVDLSWSAPSCNGGSTITDYKVEYSSNNGGTWELFTHGSSSSASHTITGLTNGMSYIFRVSTINDSGTSLPSSSSSAVIPLGPPAQPTDLVVTPGNGQVSIAFSPGDDGGSAITDYFIEYSSNGGDDWDVYVHTPSTSSPQTISGLSNYKEYFFILSAKNIEGIGDEAEVTTPTTPRGTLSTIQLKRQSSGLISGQVFTTQPQISLKDQDSATLVTDSSTVITVTISAGATLIGNTTATARAGIATFVGLGISGTGGSTYALTYSAPGVSSVTQSITLAITAPATITLSLSTNLFTAEKGKVSTINAAISTSGKVTFYANGKVISGCIKKSASASAVCSWKPAIQGRITQLKALLVPNSSSYQNVFSPILGVTATRRTGLR